MRNRLKAAAAAFAAMTISVPAVTGAAGEMKHGYYLTEVSGAFADVVADLQDGIVNRGLVIDYTGYVGDMLERTGTVVEAATPFADAEYLHFCSAERTHAAVAADPENIAICPYVVFAYSLTATPGRVFVGFRQPQGAPGAESEAAIGAIEALLREIVDEAAGG